MSKTQNNATVRKAFGKLLPEFPEYTGPAVIEVGYAVDELDSLDEVPEDEKLSDEDILGVINGRRNAAARAKAVNAKLAEYGITAPALSTEEKAFNKVVSGLKMAGMSEDDARQMAEQVLSAKK